MLPHQRRHRSSRSITGLFPLQRITHRNAKLKRKQPLRAHPGNFPGSPATDLRRWGGRAHEGKIAEAKNRCVSLLSGSHRHGTTNQPMASMRSGKSSSKKTNRCTKMRSQNRLTRGFDRFRHLISAHMLFVFYRLRNILVYTPPGGVYPHER